MRNRPEPSLALAEVVRIERPVDLPGVEVVVASPANRWFPSRVSETLGICLKIGPGHDVRAQGRPMTYPADAICVRAPGCVWSSGPTGPTGFLSVDVPASALPPDLRLAPMGFAPADELGDVRALASVLCGAGLALEKDHAIAAWMLRLGAVAGRPAAGGGEREGRLAAQRARDFLLASVEESPRLDSVARAAGTNKFTLVRAFRRAYGVTPHAFLLQAKVERSRALLAAGARPGEVAARLGFADQPHFTRVFSAVVGVTPGVWRERVGGSGGAGSIAFKSGRPGRGSEEA